MSLHLSVPFGLFTHIGPLIHSLPLGALSTSCLWSEGLRVVCAGPAPVNGVSNKYVTINCQMLIVHE